MTVSGNWYWVVTTSATRPTAQQIKAGQTHTGTAAPSRGSRNVRSGNSYLTNMGGLLQNTSYWAHSVVERTGGGFSQTVTAPGFTTAALLIELSNTIVYHAAAIGTLVGTASIAGPFDGSPQWALTNSAGGKYEIDIDTGDVTVAASLTAGSDQITVAVTNVNPTPAPRTFSITVFDDSVVTLHSIWIGDTQ